MNNTRITQVEPELTQLQQFDREHMPKILSDAIRFFANGTQTSLQKECDNVKVVIEQNRELNKLCVRLTKNLVKMTREVDYKENLIKILNNTVKFSATNKDTGFEEYLNNPAGSDMDDEEKAIIAYEDDTFYMGEVNDLSLPSGAGAIYDKDGKFIFDGNFDGGQRSGLGTEFENGQKIFRGQYFNGQRHVGTEFKHGKITFYGSYLNGQRNSCGVEFENGQKIFQGRYLDGQRSGPGTEFENEQIVFDGSYKAGQRDGVGKEFKHGKMTFHGSYLNDQRSRGAEYKDNWKTFTGSYKNGQRHGNGTELRNGQIIFKGYYEMDQRKNGTEFENNKAVCFCNYNKGLRDGKGQLFIYTDRSDHSDESININFENGIIRGSFYKDVMIDYNGIDKNGHLKFTMRCMQQSGYPHGLEYSIATDEQGNIINSDIITANLHNGETFTGTIGKNYLPAYGVVTKENGEERVFGYNRFQDGSAFKGMLDKDVRPDGFGLFFKNTQTEGIDVVFKHGSIVHDVDDLHNSGIHLSDFTVHKIVQLIREQNIATDSDEFSEFSCRISFEFMEKPACLLTWIDDKKEPITDYFDSANLIRWIEESGTHPNNRSKVNMTDIKKPEREFMEKWKGVLLSKLKDLPELADHLPFKNPELFFQEHMSAIPDKPFISFLLEFCQRITNDPNSSLLFIRPYRS